MNRTATTTLPQALRLFFYSCALVVLLLSSCTSSEWLSATCFMGVNNGSLAVKYVWGTHIAVVVEELSEGGTTELFRKEYQIARPWGISCGWDYFFVWFPFDGTAEIFRDNQFLRRCSYPLPTDPTDEDYFLVVGAKSFSSSLGTEIVVIWEKLYDSNKVNSVLCRSNVLLPSQQRKQGEAGGEEGDRSMECFSVVEELSLSNSSRSLSVLVAAGDDHAFFHTTELNPPTRLISYDFDKKAIVAEQSAPHATAIAVSPNAQQLALATSTQAVIFSNNNRGGAAGWTFVGNLTFPDKALKWEWIGYSSQVLVGKSRPTDNDLSSVAFFHYNTSTTCSSDTTTGLGCLLPTLNSTVELRAPKVQASTNYKAAARGDFVAVQDYYCRLSPPGYHYSNSRTQPCPPDYCPEGAVVPVPNDFYANRMDVGKAFMFMTNSMSGENSWGEALLGALVDKQYGIMALMLIALMMVVIAVMIIPLGGTCDAVRRQFLLPVLRKADIFFHKPSQSNNEHQEQHQHQYFTGREEEDDGRESLSERFLVATGSCLTIVLVYLLLAATMVVLLFFPTYSQYCDYSKPLPRGELVNIQRTSQLQPLYSFTALPLRPSSSSKALSEAHSFAYLSSPQYSSSSSVSFSSSFPVSIFEYHPIGIEVRMQGFRGSCTPSTIQFKCQEEGRCSHIGSEAEFQEEPYFECVVRQTLLADFEARTSFMLQLGLNETVCLQSWTWNLTTPFFSSVSSVSAEDVLHRHNMSVQGFSRLPVQDVYIALVPTSSILGEDPFIIEFVVEADRAFTYNHQKKAIQWQELAVVLVMGTFSICHLAYTLFYVLHSLLVFGTRKIGQRNGRVATASSPASCLRNGCWRWWWRWPLCCREGDRDSEVVGHHLSQPKLHGKHFATAPSSRSSGSVPTSATSSPCYSCLSSPSPSPCSWMSCSAPSTVGQHRHHRSSGFLGSRRRRSLHQYFVAEEEEKGER
ncbi:hypothetical protein QOT17_018023 [Balamuthia mandrillaris]